MSTVVLNVDDSLDDVLLMKRASQKAQAKFDLHFVEDGELAIEYLLGRGIYADRSEHPLPEFILLDLKMPRKSGLEVLEWLRAQAEFRQIPVAIFTSSTNDEDIRGAVNRGADCYLAKPIDYESLVSLMTKLDRLLRDSAIPHAAALRQLPECCVEQMRAK